MDVSWGWRNASLQQFGGRMIEMVGVAVRLAFPRQKGHTQLDISEVTCSGRRYILCRNEEQAKKDAETRAALIAGLEQKLAQGNKALVANTGYRRFLKEPEGEGFVIDPAKVAADAQFDGLFVLRTSLKLAALRVALRYRKLLAVEDSFKTAKAVLATRPIFHRTDAACAATSSAPSSPWCCGTSSS